MTSIRSRLARGSLWISVARGVTNGLQALSTIVLARLLAPADFGLVALATSLLAVLSAFTDLSLSQALVHTREPTREHYNTAWTLGLARGALLALGFAAAGPLSAVAYHEPRLNNIMYALAFSALLGGLQNPKLVILARDLRFHQSFVLGVLSSLASVVISISIAAIYRSYWALVMGIVGGQLVSLVLSYVIFPYRPGVSWSRFRELWQFSVWVSLSQIMNTLNYRFDQLLVGTFLGRRELGFYTVGNRLAVLPGQEMVRPLTTTLFPAFRLVAEDKPRLRLAYQRVQGLVTAVALPASLGFGLIADPTVRLLLGAKWVGAIPVVQLIAILYSLDTLGSLVVPLAMGAGETRTLFFRNVQKLAIRAPMLVVGIYVGGLYGLLYARMIAGVIGVLVDMVMIDRLIQLTVLAQLRANWRCFVACGAMAIAALGVQAVLPPVGSSIVIGIMLLSIVILTAGITYVAVSWLLWRLAGKPPGPEQEVSNVAAGLLKRVASLHAVGGVQSRKSP